MKMIILLKELRKIFDIRLVIGIIVFTVLFYNMFMEITRHPCGGQCTDSSYDIPFAAKLVDEFGPKIEFDEWYKLENKEKQIEEKIEKEIAGNEILNSNGITTLKELYEKENELYEKGSLNENEKLLEKKIDEFILYNEKTGKMFFELQCLENIKEFRGIIYGVSKKDVAKLDNRDAKRMTKQYVSLLPEGVLYIFNEDMKYMSALIIIISFVLICAYQIRERLSGVMPLYVSTKVGRKIFSVQLFASIIAVLIVSALQLGIYTLMYYPKGLAIFWSCENWSCARNSFLFDGISFGTYMFIFEMAVLMFCVFGAIFVYCIARLAENYIWGIIFSIICGTGMFFTVKNLTYEMFDYELNTGMSVYIKPIMIVIICVAMCLIAKIRINRDKARDIYQM